MKLYKNRINKFITAMLVVAILLNTLLFNKFNVVVATQSEQTDEEIVIKEIGSFYKENINSILYYVQKFSVTSESTVQGYSISINNFPDNTKILDTNDNEITNLVEETFKLAIPHKNIKENLKGIININNKQYEFSKETNKSSIITKVTYKNGIPKPNTTIDLKMGENLISSGITNENGIIEFSGLHPGRYSVYEKDINGNIVGEFPIVLDLLYNEQVNINVLNEISDGTNIIVENEKKKGLIEVHLINGDYKDVYLANLEIEIYDFENNLIETLTTDENGIAISSRLPIDSMYKVKQKTTLKDYDIDSEMKEVQFKENDEVFVIEITNYIKKNFIKITKVDKDNNDIKLQGVIFGIYDADNKLIEEITTDQNGEAISSNLPINKAYYIKEVKTLDNYILDDKTITVFLTETDSQAGEINVNRLSSTNNCLILENQKIYNILPKFGC